MADDRQGPRAGKKEKKATKRTFSLFGLFGAFIVLTLAVGLAVAAVSSALYVRRLAADLPSLEQMARQRPNLATEIYDRQNRLIARLFLENRTWVGLEQISPWMQKATVAAEDGTFYDHRGIDFSSILRAFWVNVTHGRTRQGASTITQQLARNLFLSQERTIERKAKEAILALRLERLYTKNQILEMYLNTIYFGHGTWGIAAASQTYFAKKPHQLSVAESTLLAGLIAAPELYSPYRSMERARARQGYVIRRLVDLGMLDGEEAQAALAASLTLQKGKESQATLNKAPYFISHILFNHLLPTYGKEMVYQEGLRVYTTIDLELQKAAQEALRTLKSDGALVALAPGTGEVLSLVGGKDFEVSKFNRAIQAYRQPGSAFKPFVYAAALQEGLRPVDHVLDAPLIYENGWEPKNYSEEFKGEITLLEALTHSYNVSTIRVAESIGIGKVIAMARNLGITSPHLPHDLSLSLGSGSVTPLELAQAYCPFANGGFRVTPYFIREIRSHDGEILEQQGPQMSQAISSELAAEMQGMLKNVVRAGTGRSVAIKGMEVFGKTGTTNEWSDAWFVGGVPGVVAVVYAGHDDHKPLGNRATGSSVAAPVWKAFMEKALVELRPPSTFFLGDAQVEQVVLCKETGYLASPSCPGVEVLMERDKIPSSICPFHGGDWYTAQMDPLAPRLILVRDDELLLAQYGLGRVATVAQEAPEPSAFQPPTPPTPAPPPPSGGGQPYKSDPSPAQTIEDRYQELLQQYGLN
ncbi:MAG: PBP1A family penicillin-binding protein [Synergistaceae bacterium]|nr:PBP1A family penicillin-binding protein [Synergistaceae bacterium]